MAFSVATYVLKNNARERHEREERRRRQSQLEVDLRQSSTILEETCPGVSARGNRIGAGQGASASIYAMDEVDLDMGTVAVEEERGESSNCSASGSGGSRSDEETGEGAEAGGGEGEGELYECRICQLEDLKSNLDSPCLCRGSLQYVHHKCLQTWCLEKGDTICEICKSPLKGNYQCPPRPTGPSPTANASAFVGWLIPSIEASRTQETSASDQYRRWRKAYLWAIMGISVLYVVIFGFLRGEGGGVPKSLAYVVNFLFRVLALFIAFVVLVRVVAIAWRFYHSEREPTIFLYNTSRGGQDARRVVLV